MPPNSVAGGRDAKGEVYLVGRATHRDAKGNLFPNIVIPGKIHPSHVCVYYSLEGEEDEWTEYKQTEYEVLVRGNSSQESLQWVHTSGNDIPLNAVEGGKLNNETLYVGRHRHEGSLVIGHVQPSKRLVVSHNLCV